MKDVSFKIEQGDIFGIVGASGAGKSTLLRTINLLQPVSGGHVLVDGKAVEKYKGRQLRELRQNIGMIFQHFNLAGSKTVYENIAFVLQAAGWKKEAIDKRVRELLDFVNLSEKINEYPSKLSGGQKQRVAIARALANNTRILLCDEPTSALDAETTAAVLKLLREINEKLNITIILITHELDVVKSICHRVAVMQDGGVVEIGEVYDVFTDTQHDFTKQLIAHTHSFDLPESVLEHVTGPVLKLVYQGGTATEPVLSRASEKYGVDFNILHGKIEYIDDKPLGILFVNVTGHQDNVKEAQAYLKENVSALEVIRHA